MSGHSNEAQAAMTFDFGGGGGGGKEGVEGVCCKSARQGQVGKGALWGAGSTPWN